MPSAETIIWGTIGGLIILMLGIIGYLLDSGFRGVKEQLESIWEKINMHQAQAEENARRLAAMEARCEERHRKDK